MIINVNEITYFKNSAISTYNKSISDNSSLNLTKINNRDTFEYSRSISLTSGIYNANRTATTDEQRRKIPYLLAAKIAGLDVNSSYMPIINSATDSNAYSSAMQTIKGNHANLQVNSSYRYSQTGNNYGYNNAISSCATYALATALSIHKNEMITPDEIVTTSSTNGHNPNWVHHGAHSFTASEEDTMLAIDAQLQLGHPVLIHATGFSSDGVASEHWATVIGKNNGEYTIIDPYYGDVRSLSNMQIYKNDGQIVGYAIISDNY